MVKPKRIAPTPPVRPHKRTYSTVEAAMAAHPGKIIFDGFGWPRNPGVYLDENSEWRLPDDKT